MSASEDTGTAAATPDETPAKHFDPTRFLVSLNGRGDYLEVKWRLLWLRTEHPDASIETEQHGIDKGLAIFKATITLPSGGAATGWGSESPGDFRDYIEKAETKAIGRALAALGYGTQFCQDFDHGDTGATGPGTNAAPATTERKTIGGKKGQAPAKETREQVRARMEAAIADADRHVDQRIAALDWLFRDAATADRVRGLWATVQEIGLTDERAQRSYLQAALRFNPSEGG